MHGEKEDGEKERRRTHGHICLPLRQNCLVGIGIVTALLLLGRLMSVLAGGSHRQAAFAMSLGAGMATGVGASFVLCTSTLDRRLLACTMAFSAGVMIYVSLVEVVGVSTEYFEKALKPPLAYTCYSQEGRAVHMLEGPWRQGRRPASRAPCREVAPRAVG